MQCAGCGDDIEHQAQEAAGLVVLCDECVGTYCADCGEYIGEYSKWVGDPLVTIETCVACTELDAVVQMLRQLARLIELRQDPRPLKEQAIEALTDDRYWRYW